MKRYLVVAAMLGSVAATAQKEAPVTPYNKQYIDSLLGDAFRKKQPLILPAPGNGVNPFTVSPNKTFEELNPGASAINKTSRGTIYSMPTDNMAVLSPDMNLTEKMPGSNRIYKVAPRSNMPNPLYPRIIPKRKK